MTINIYLNRLIEFRHAWETATRKDSIEHDYDSNASSFTLAAFSEKSHIIIQKIKPWLEKQKDWKEFNKTNDRILDIGCGSALVSLPLLRSGYKVDCIDSSESMTIQAQETLSRYHLDKNLFDPSQIQTKTLNNVSNLQNENNQGLYKVAMLNFVHQCARNTDELKTFFNLAKNALQKNGTLMIIGAHPELLHAPHTWCEYDVQDNNNGQSEHRYTKYINNAHVPIREGDTYSGRIFAENPNIEPYKLSGDHYWSKHTLLEVGTQSGFDIGEVQNIADHPGSLTRTGQSTDAYLFMTFTKK